MFVRVPTLASPLKPLVVSRGSLKNEKNGYFQPVNLYYVQLDISPFLGRYFYYITYHSHFQAFFKTVDGVLLMLCQ